MTRRARIGLTIGVLLGLQVAAILIYLAVERSRTPSAAAATFKAERVAASEPAPTIAAKRIDGSDASISWPSANVRIVHFWGTWCEPCVDELPGLLAFGRDLRELGLEVVAIAVDDKWEDVQRFFGGSVPPEIVMATDKAVHKRFGVSTLPDSYLVDRTGKVVERYFGARDWRAPAARDHVLGFVR